MKLCAVCEGAHHRAATYESPALLVGLPALACEGCGNLELDERRALRIADALDAPHLSTLSSHTLRSEVQRLLGKRSALSSWPPGGPLTACGELDVESRRDDGLKRLFHAVTGKPLEESTRPAERQDDPDGGDGSAQARRPARVVLVVDDAALIRQRVRRCLAAANIQVIEAPDGAEALKMVRANPDIALVVSDVHMPRLDGLQLLEEIRKDESTRELPFLVLTTETQATLVERARDLRVQGWLLKPLRPDLLLVAVNKLIAPDGTGSTSERAVP